MGLLDPGLDRLRADLVQEIRASEARTAQRFDAVDAKFEMVDTRIRDIEMRLRSHIDAAEAGLRRHFGVLADDLRSPIEVVAEGVVALDEKMERFRGEVQENFARVDRRFLHLEARASGREPR
jgi:hypothetical protein